MGQSLDHLLIIASLIMNIYALHIYVVFRFHTDFCLLHIFHFSLFCLIVEIFLFFLTLQVLRNSASSTYLSEFSICSFLRRLIRFNWPLKSKFISHLSFFNAYTRNFIYTKSAYRYCNSLSVFINHINALIGNQLIVLYIFLIDDENWTRNNIFASLTDEC